MINFDKSKYKLAIGLLSGTSVDGIDAVLIKIKGSGVNTNIKIIDFQTYPINSNLRRMILKNSSKHTSNVFEICGLNSLLGKEFANSGLKLIKKNNLKPSQIVFIGSHGQTIHHIPSKKYFGIKSTLQIGDPSVISNVTGITTVGDYRIADCSVDGDGAPLVSFLDYILFTSKTKNRLLLNIGGISNFTVLKKNAKRDDVIAFDTGPGNMIIDGVIKKLFKKNYDRNGEVAFKGKMSKILFSFLRNDSYYKLKPPKSTGREFYGEIFQKRLLNRCKGISQNDIIYTISEFTSYSIHYNYKKFVSNKIKVDELFVSGGGAKNNFLMKRLKYYFKGVRVKELHQSGLTSDNKEAVLFAVLANECLCGNAANMPNVTGAKRNVILGKICQGEL